MNQNLSEQQVRQIIKDEMQKSPFRFSAISPHRHNGVDNLQISEQDIVGRRINSGVILFENQAQYTLAINFLPKSLWFYGLVVDGTNNIKGQCIGNALLNGAYTMTASTSRSTGVSSSTQSIVQSSSFFLVDNTGVSPIFHTDAQENNLVGVQYPLNGTVYVKAVITSFSNSGIVINVSVLASGWSCKGNFVIT